MRNKSLLLKITLLGLVALLAACGGSDDSDDLPDSTPVPTAITSDISGSGLNLAAEDRLLVWTGLGTAPGRIASGTPSELLLLSSSGEQTRLLDLPAGTTRALPCTEQAASPDGAHFAFFAGGDSGSLYLITGTDSPQVAAQTGALTCLGMGTLRYSPDSARLGFIDFPADATSGSFPAGTLRILSTSNMEELGNFEDVISFDMGDESAAFVRFFAGSDGQTNEAGIFHWTGDGAREITTIFTSEGCQFRSAGLVRAGEGSLIVLFGEHCSGQSGSSWSLYTVDVEGRSAASVRGGRELGSIYPQGRANILIVSPDYENIVFTAPDGLARNRTNLYMLPLADSGGDLLPLLRHVVIPYAAGTPYDPAANALPALSPDGSWLAVTSRDANDNTAVHIIDLLSPDLPPISISGGGRGDTISSLAFSGDSRQLLFVAGGNDSGANSLFSVDLNTADDVRVLRGRYARGLIVSPDGSAVAMSDWELQPDPYQTLIVVDIAESRNATLVTGADVVDDDLVDQRFIFPLAWRR